MDFRECPYGETKVMAERELAKPARWMTCSGEPALSASRKMVVEVERFSVDSGSYGVSSRLGCSHARVDVLLATRNA
jgi:hypothetical protein